MWKFKTLRDMPNTLGQARTSVPQYGGKYIVRGGKVEVLEGPWRPNRMVVIEFASFDEAKRWYRFPEYQAALQGRLRSAESKVIIVDGA
jgi:uncharacterized protein (DUF1330 family)